MSNVNRGEKILNRLVSEQKITPCGRDFLVATLDPFHDSQLDNLEGWPDMESGASVVRCIKKSLQLSCPTALAAGTWDCYIDMHPTLLGRNVEGENSVVWEACQREGQILRPAPWLTATTAAHCGGVTAFGTPTGVDRQFLNTATNVFLGSIELDNQFTQGSGRLIAIGFEVHNTTAEIYRQGTCTVFRMQAENRDICTMNIVTNRSDTLYPVLGSVSVQPLRAPPKNQGQAMLIQGSRQWTAAEGCYVVGAHTTMDNPAIGIPQSIPMMEQDPDYEDLDGDLAGRSQYIPRMNNVTQQSGVTAPFNNLWTPTYQALRVHNIHQSGAIFSGLSAQSTLTLNVNYFYESFPGPAEKAVLVLAKPSCKLDLSAMEFYSRIIQELPVGVPVAENGLGDWFLDAASKAAKYIGPVLAALPHPIAKGAGAALTYLGSTGQDYVKRQNQLQQPPNSWESQSGMPSDNLQREVNKIKKKEKKIEKQVKKNKKKHKNPVPQAGPLRNGYRYQG